MPPNIVRAPGRFDTAKKAGLVAAVVGVHLLPAVVIAKLAQFRNQYLRRKHGVGIDRRQFASLPRQRQTGIIYYRNQQLQDLRAIHEAGYRPRGGLRF